MKKNLFVFALVGILLVSAPSQVQAQSTFENPFADISQKIKQGFQKLYLSLPGDKDGRAVLHQSTMAMEDVTSVNSTTKMNLVAQGNGSDLVTLNTSFSGPMKISDIYDPAAYQQDMNLKAELIMEGTTLNADADMKIDGQEAYLRINQMPAIPFFQMTQIKDKWIQLEKPQASEIEGVDETDTTLTAEQRAELEQLYQELVEEAEVSTARKETVEGLDVFIVEATFNDDQIKRFVQRHAEILDQTEDQITELMADVDRVLAVMSPLTTTTVIDRKTYYTRSFSAPLVFDLSSVDTSALSQLSASMPIVDLSTLDTVEANISMTFDQFNEPVDFVVPAEVESMEALFGSAMGGGYMMQEPPAELQNGSETNGRGVGAGSPAELKNLSAEELEMLKAYGIDPNEL